MGIQFFREALTASEQSVVTEGFRQHTGTLDAPDYAKHPLKWLGFDTRGDLNAVLTADILWDWMYVDELWVSAESRGEGRGKKLMQLAEEFAQSEGLQGVWLWTQSWQAEDFYRHLGYREFTRFDNFPQGHARIGFRKRLI